MKTENLRGVITDDQVAEMQRRNDERARQAAASLGRGYLLDPANKVERKNPFIDRTKAVALR